jgi:GT2 family glycosyltransferase
MPKVRLVVATRAAQADVMDKTAIGRSLRLQRFPGLEIRLAPENRAGLPQVYNAAIEASRDDPCLLVFAHDDIHILDFNWVDSLAAGLERFQVVGLAGNKRRVPRQPSWAFVDTRFTWDARENLSGVVGHGKGFPPANLSVFGAPGQQVKLLDGLLLAAWSRTLIEHELRFDERFDFHFYDMDLCRSAEQKGVSCGTCALSVVHESGGSFGTPAWQAAYARYLEKWGE